MSPNNPVARIEAIACASPSTDVEPGYKQWAGDRLADPRDAKLFNRMSERSGIDHRWSVLDGEDTLETGRFYAPGESPGTAERMAIYVREAPRLALTAIRKLPSLDGITHLVVASCTGFMAPGLDQIIARELHLSDRIERLMIGFMGCYAGATALRTAGHLARANPGSRVLVVAVELCSLHLQDSTALEPTLAMAQFSDGAAAALVSTEGPGLAIGEGLSAALEQSDELITWHIGDTGFAMHLSGEVPGRLAHALSDPQLARRICGNQRASDIEGWAIHPGGKSILDAVERALVLPADALADSREVLRAFGNMSSATVLFVLERMLARRPATGVALAFGPGLAMEGFRFGWTDGDAG